jgi:hypothetical protein
VVARRKQGALELDLRTVPPASDRYLARLVSAALSE